MVVERSGNGRGILGTLGDVRWGRRREEGGVGGVGDKVHKVHMVQGERDGGGAEVVSKGYAAPGLV